MNLELIRELTSLHSQNTSYTEMAEITGMARTSIVLALRLNTIFEDFYSSKILSLNEEIKLLKSNVVSLESKVIEQDKEIQKLNSLLDVDDDSHMIISKQSYEALNNEVVTLEAKVDKLDDLLSSEHNYLDNLSLTDKIKKLFQ